MSEPLIKVRHLYKSFGNLCAVKGIGFDVEEGRCVGLLGPNGAGKTTTLKMLYGMCRWDDDSATTVDISGFDPKSHELEIKYLSGVVPQDDNLDSELKARQNLLIYARFYGLEKAVAHKRIDDLFEFLELAEKSEARIRELSGGMKRRLLIARALLNNPRLLILDEPTTGLDPQVRHLIWDRIRRLKEGGVTILLTTHYMEEAFQLCDKVIIMNEGRIVAEGDPAELIKSRMEQFVLEVIRPDVLRREGISLDAPGLRKEVAHDVTYLYANDPHDLMRVSETLPGGAAQVRPANLEDLFLKITGRKLHEKQ